MKQIIVSFVIMLVAFECMQAQQRDRRADLNMPCATEVSMSPSGRLWLYDRCGNIWTADDIHSTWRKVLFGSENWMDINEKMRFCNIVSFDDKSASAFGNDYPDAFLLHTKDGGVTWDTLYHITGYRWEEEGCSLADGHVWQVISSHVGHNTVAYSSDSGLHFTILMPPFVDPDYPDGGIKDIYMLNADSGFVCTHDAHIYSTSDNWFTSHLVLDSECQRSVSNCENEDQWNKCNCIWKEFLSSVRKKPDGDLYCIDDYGAVHVGEDGKADTCCFFTTEQTIEESLAVTYGLKGTLIIIPYEESYVPQIPVTIHGGRQWTHNRHSIFMRDDTGWFRIAKPMNIRHMTQDPQRQDRVVVMLNNKKLYSVDTAGNIERYKYNGLFDGFVRSGLKSVSIGTSFGGCFHYEEHKVSFARNGDKLVETYNNVDTTVHPLRSIDAATIEQALMELDSCYDEFPRPKDFGLRDGTVDLRRVYPEEEFETCTDYSGYWLFFVNLAGDTLYASGSSDQDCGDYFPWLLPMQMVYKDNVVNTYQPILWHALLPMIHDSMILRDKLSNSSLYRIKPCDLLFFENGGSDMDDAIQQSSGRYTHVAMVESVCDTIWIIDATPQHGVCRRPLFIDYSDNNSIPALYGIDGRINTQAVLERARSFLGQPYDNAFLPDNGAMYCSELIYECYLQEDGSHLFEAKPMNWRNADGKLPKYWVKHFRRLGMQVPEGVLGTNPNDLSKSNELSKKEL